MVSQAPGLRFASTVEVVNRAGLAVAIAVLAVVLVLAITVAVRAGAPAPQTNKAPPVTTPASPAFSPTTPSPTPTGPALLLPNLRSLRASDLSVEVLNGQRRLRFTASLANLGPGPLLLRPRGRSSCPAGQHSAVQVLYADTNADKVFSRARDRESERRAVGCRLHHPGHKHWHFDAMAAYSLRRPGSADALVSRDKVSFCLRDNRRITGQRAVVRRAHFGRCSRTSHQGISPGWIDVYTAKLSGQWLRLPGGSGPQLLCLDLAADPLRRIAETNETDNATSVAIRVSGTAVRRVDSGLCR
jgi:hypothetical protein